MSVERLLVIESFHLSFPFVRVRIPGSAEYRERSQMTNDTG